MNQAASKRGNILGITTTALGDTVLNIPAINAIGRMHEIDLVVHSRNSDIFYNNKLIRHVITYRNNPVCRKYVAWKLRGTRYDSVVILHANSDILKLLPMIAYERAYGVQPWNIPQLNLTQIHYDSGEHHIDKRMKLAQAVGVEAGDEPMVIALSEQELLFSQQWLAARQVRHPFICVCPGASLPYRRWPVERFGQLIHGLSKAHPELGIVIIGSREEISLFRTIKRYCPTVVPAIGLGLRQLSSILHRAELLVTNDTGPMHLGQAVGTKVLALFGPSDPITIGPRGPGHRVIASSPTCTPCITKKCKDPICMLRIPVESVFEATEEVLRFRR